MQSLKFQGFFATLDYSNGASLSDGKRHSIPELYGVYSVSTVKFGLTIAVFLQRNTEGMFASVRQLQLASADDHCVNLLNHEH